MKKLLLLIISILLLALLTGCNAEYIYDMSDGSNARVTFNMYIPKDEYDKTASDSDRTGLEVVTLEDGKQYYKSTQSDVQSIEQVNEKNTTGVVSSDFVYLPLDTVDSQVQDNDNSSDKTDSTQSVQNSVNLKLIFVLSDEITETNGVLSEDKRKVTFDYAVPPQGAFYAYTAVSKAKVDADKTAPVIQGLSKKKYYHELKNIKISDDTALSSVTCNGNKLTKSTVKSKDKTDYYWIMSGKNRFKEGKNTIRATDINGNATEFIFNYDSKVPVVKGISNFGTYKDKAVFYVKDKKSGFDKVTCSRDRGKYKKVKSSNIKKVKKGKYKGYYQVTVEASGNRTLYLNIYDKAGNYVNFVLYNRK